MTDIGDRIRAERERRGWSVGRLAREAGLAEGWVAQVEGGSIAKPSPERMVRLAIALGVDAEVLLVGAGWEPAHVEILLCELDEDGDLLVEFEVGEALTHVAGTRVTVLVQPVEGVGATAVRVWEQGLLAYDLLGGPGGGAVTWETERDGEIPPGVVSVLVSVTAGDQMGVSGPVTFREKS